MHPLPKAKIICQKKRTHILSLPVLVGSPTPYPRRRLFVKKEPISYHYLSAVLVINFVDNFIFVLRLPNKGIREQICKIISGNLGSRSLTCVRPKKNYNS
jgi:hypothetical protein